MKIRAAAPLALLLCIACADESAPEMLETAAGYETREVVTEAVRALEARLVETAPPGDDAPEDQRERVLGLVGIAAGGEARMIAVALEEARELGPEAVPLLVESLADETLPVAERSAAATLLAATDTAAGAEVLLGRVSGDDPAWLRAHCAWKLGETSQDWVLPHLVLRLKYETDALVPIWIAATLARFENFSGLRALSTLAASAPKEGERRDAAALLWSLARERGFEDPAALERAWLDGALDGTREGSPPSDRLRLEIWRQIQALPEWQLRGVDDARFVLSRLGRSAAEQLAEALRDDNTYLRTHAAQCLERMGPRGRVAGPALVAALEDPLLGHQAALALGGIRYAEALPELTALLAPEQPLELRMAAAWALGAIGEERARAELEALLSEDEPLELRAAGAEGIVLIGGDRAPEAARLLAELLVSPAVEPSRIERALAIWLAREAEAPGALAEAWRRWSEAGEAEGPRRRELRRDALLEALPARGDG